MISTRAPTVDDSYKYTPAQVPSKVPGTRYALSYSQLLEARSIQKEVTLVNYGGATVHADKREGIPRSDVLPALPLEGGQCCDVMDTINRGKAYRR